LKGTGTDSNPGAALVLDGHSRAALESLQSLGRMGIAVDVTAEADSLAKRSRYCRRYLRQPSTLDYQGFLAWLEDLVNTNDYKLIIPSTENSLRFMRSLAESNPIRRAAVLPSNRSLDVALSKVLTWELALTLGIPIPSSRVISSKDEVVEPETFPIVLKPASSQMLVDNQTVLVAPIIVRNLEDWKRSLTHLLLMGQVLEQQYVDGRGVGIECLYKDGTVLWHFQHERVHELPLTGGGSSYRHSVPVDSELLAMSKKLLDHLGWHGVAMVEFKGNADLGYHLMEINPRLWGSLALPIDVGVDFPKGLWCLATGRDPGPQPNYQSPYYTRNLEMDLSWIKENIRADHSDPLLLTLPRLRSILEYGRPLLGIESWDFFDIWDPRILCQVLYNWFKANWQTVKAMMYKAINLYRASWRHRKILARLGSNASPQIQRVLFVCYGNICRSSLAQLHAMKLFPDFEVESAGFHDVVGRMAPQWFQSVALELGIDLSLCRSQRLGPAQVEWAQLILLADLDNFNRFEHEFPDAMSKTTMLGMFLPEPSVVIKDPYDLDSDGAAVVAKKVLQAVEGLAAWARIRHKPLFGSCYTRVIQKDTGISVNVCKSFTEYLMSMGRHTRYSAYNQRKYLHRLGSVDIDHAKTGTIDSYLEKMNELHALRWGSPCFSKESLEFHKKLAMVLSAENKLKLSVISLSNRPISVLYDIRMGNREYNIQAGFDSAVDGKLSPGLLHLGYAIESAFTCENITEYDFLAGPGMNIFYKSHLGSRKTEFISLQINRRVYLKVLYKLYDSLPRYFKSIIKHIFITRKRLSID